MSAVERTFLSLEHFKKDYAPSPGVVTQMTYPKFSYPSLSVDQSGVDAWIQTGNELQKEVAKRFGAELIITLVPNKESIYRYTADAAKPDFHELLKRSSQREAFQFIDLFELYRLGYQKSGTIYHLLDDTHWNAAGVKLLVSEFQNLQPSSTPVSNVPKSLMAK